LAAYAGDCAISECFVFTLQRVAKVLKLASRGNIFLLTSWEFGNRKY